MIDSDRWCTSSRPKAIYQTDIIGLDWGWWLVGTFSLYIASNWTGGWGVPWDGMMVFCDLDGFKSGDDVHQTAMVW